MSARAIMEPRQLVEAWIDAFNRADVEALAAFYSENATNHQVAEAPVVGRAAIRAMFAAEFARAEIMCIVETFSRTANGRCLVAGSRGSVKL
jgi:ketosteroid isomerase-like protein